MSVVHYKFKNNLDYKTISFDGLSISLGDFKQAIMSQNKTKSGEFDLEVKDAQSKEAYTDNATQIQKNASVIIRRIPVGPKGKALTAAERPQSPGDAAKPNEDEVNDESPVIPLSKLNKVADLASANASEEDKIAAMMSQAGEDWDPTLYAKPKGRSFNAAPRVPPPPHYMCFRCRKPGHWIQNCPKNNDPNYDLKVRRTTGIPKSFLRLAVNPTQKGALLIPDTGQYAVPIVDHNAYEQAAMKKRKDGQATIVEIEKPIPPEYFCPLCKKIMNNAVVVPCCGDSFCDTCIEKYLLENEHVCPSCPTEDVSPASIVINKHLRQAIIKFKSSGFDVGSLSATSSPSAHRDSDVITQGRTTPVVTPAPVVTTTTNVAATVRTAAPTLNTVVSSPAVEPSKAIGDGPVACTAVSTSSTPHTAPVVSQDKSAPTAATVLQGALPQAALPQAAIIDPRLQRPEGMVQPMAVPVPAAVTLAPVHRPAYVVSASTVAHSYHPHHALVHPTVPGIATTYGHLSHPALVPTRHTLPFAALETNVGMMNEEEFYRAKMKLQESRGRRKRRKDEDDRKSRKKERSRSRRRERRESPSSRRSPSEAVFRSVRKDRAKRRGRSRSWTPTGSSSRSSWSHSWSKSPSRSYSRSKSRTPVNWDRSRSPSREKKARSNRVEEERRKRKKQAKDLKETKQKSKTNDDDVETSEKRNVKSDKSSEQKKELKKKSKMDAEIDSSASEKVSIKTTKTKEPKKDAKKNEVDGSMSDNRNTKNSKSNEAKKDVKKLKVDNDVDSSTLEKRNVKTVKSNEAKKEAKKDMEKSNVESDVDCSTAEKISVKKSKEPKRNAEKKSKLDADINVGSTQKVYAKSLKSKDVKKGSKIKSERDIEESASDKMNMKTVKSDELNERENVKRKMKTDEDLKEVEIETSKENTAKKRSKVDNIVSGNSEKSDVKKSGLTRKEIVKKCSISDLRDLVNNSSSLKTDPNSNNFEKSSKKDLNRKTSKADYKESERVSEISKKYTVGTKNSDVSNKMAKEIVLNAKDLGDRKERSRKKDDVLLDKGKLSRKTKEDSPAADFLVEKKSTGKSSAFKNDREEVRDKQKTTRIVVEKSKDKHAREAAKASEKCGKSVPVKEERSSKDYKLISSEIKTIKDENRKKDIRKADILKKTSSHGDIVHREVSLKTKHSSSRLDYSIGKIKHNDEVSKLRVEERVKGSSKKKTEKSRKHSVTDESDNWLSEEDIDKKANRREEKTKKKRKSVSDDSDDQKSVPRKRTKDEDSQESDDEVAEKVPKKKKKKKSSLHEEERKDSKHRKKKHKKKHKKHKHKKKSKRKERKISEDAYSEESDEDDSEKDRRESRNNEITHDQEEMSVDEESTKSVESVFEGESTKAVQSESENDPEQESGSEFERNEDESIGSGESLQDVNSESDDVVEEVEVPEEKERRDGVEEDDVEELDYNEESEPEMGQDSESEQEIEVDEGEHNGDEEQQSVDEVEDDEEQEGVEEDSEVEEGVEEDDVKEGDKGLEDEIEKEDLEQDEEQLDVDGVLEEEESLVEEHEREEECEETEENEHVEVEEMGQIELELNNENYQENEKHGIGVEDEEALLADDEGHESLPGNEFDDEVLLEDDVAEQPVQESVNEEALLEDNAVGSMRENSNDEALLRDESTRLASSSQGNEELFETDDVVNDVSDDVVDRVSECTVDVQSKENVGESNSNEIAQNFQSDLVEDGTNIISQELSDDTDSKDVKAVEDRDLQSNACDSKLLIEDFLTKPLAQSSDVGSRDKHNNGTVYHFNTTQRHNSLGNYPSYDSGVGTLDSMYADDPNYTDFGGPAENRRTSTDVFRAMISDDTEDFY